ncbi:hypothetical protein [Streptomyces sp. NPDC058735]|uniref:hypothetical protein n=1 Tax=unclassified Streptomyces TaxID=2593676 RepID=UPI0036935946
MNKAGEWCGRRTEAVRGGVTALLAVAACAGHATKAGLPWWAVLAVAVSTTGLAGWKGARTGGPGARRLEPPDSILGACEPSTPADRILGTCAPPQPPAGHPPSPGR